MLPLVRRVRLIAFVLLLGGTAALPVAAQPAPAAPVPLTSEVRSGKLPNGLRYFIRKNTRPQGRADMRLVVNAGSILEDDDQLGAAHFIEHMVFNGTKRFPKNELISYLQSVGVRLGGDLNANTGFDETIYVLPIPVADSAVLQTGLAILREWAGNALLEEGDIDAERGVVLAELRSGRAADERVRRQSLPRMFNGSRYAARLPIGTERSLYTMTGDALRRFYRDWYRPDLQAVIVVGDIDPDDIERRIRGLFSDLVNPPDPRPRPARFEIPARTTLEALVVTDPELASGRVDLTQYVRPQPSLASIGAYDALIKDLLVNRMFGMRLYELTDQPVRPFLAAQAQRSAIVRGYEAFVAAAAIAGQDPVAVTRLLATEIERVVRFGFTKEEFDAAKQDVLNRYAQAAAEEDKSESDSLADELGRHFLTDEPVPGIAWEYGRVRELVPPLTLETINAHARMVLAEPGHQPFVMVSAPSAPGTTEAALRAAVFEAARAEITPYRGTAADVQLLAREPAAGTLVSETSDAARGTTTLTFANGVRVVLKPTDFKNDEIRLSGVRYGGQFLYEQPDHQNAVHLVSTIEAMGFGEHTPTALQRFTSTKNAFAAVQFAPYTEEAEGASTRGDLQTMLQLLHLKLTAPRLDAARYDSQRAALKGYLANLANSPDRQFEDFTMAVLSQDHPRAPRLPRPADLDKVDPARSVAMYRERFGNADGFQFAIVGSFKLADVKPLVARYLGGLPASPRPARFRDLGLRYPAGRFSRTLNTGSDNSAVTFIYSGERPYTPTDKLKLEALTEVLRLRVTDRIREALGTSYSPGVVSQFGSVPVGSFALRFWIACAVPEIPAVERAVEDIVAGVQANGPTTGELEKVTRTWLNEHERRTRTNEYWQSRLSMGAIDPILEDEEANYVARVKALTSADVQAAARTFAGGTNRVRLVLAPVGAFVAP